MFREITAELSHYMVARQSDDSTKRSYLTGKTGSQNMARRYRHDTERTCSVKRRSINAEFLEQDLQHLLEDLTVNDERMPLLIDAVERYNREQRTVDQVKEIQAEIIYWRQRAKNADTLFAKARLSEDDWRVAIEEAESEIARLETKIVERDSADIAFKLAMGMITDFIENWHEANAAKRRVLATTLFQHIEYDLDQRKIVDFKLTPWAELIMQLKLTLDDDKNTPSASAGKQRVV